MSNIFKRLLMITITLVCAVMLTSCGDKRIDRIEVKEGTFKFQYEQDDVVEFEKLVIVVSYNDGTTKEVPYGTKSLVVSELDTSKIGLKTLTIKYANVEKFYDIRVSTPSKSTVVRRAIDALPSVEEVTLDLLGEVASIRAEYDELTGDAKEAVTNIDKLVEVEAKVAELAFEKYVSDKKTVLDTYVAESNYSEAKWETILALVASAKESMKEKTTTEEIDEIVTNTKALIDEVVVLSVEIAELKAAKVSELDNYKASNEAEYSTENWNQILVIKSNSKTVINSATTLDAVVDAYNKAVSEIDNVKTKAVELAEYKEIVKSSLDSLVVDYDMADVSALLSGVRTEIDAQTTKEAVDAKKAWFIEELAKVATRAVKAVVALIEALPTNPTLENEASIIACRTAYTNLSTSEKALVSNLDKLVECENVVASLKSLEQAIDDAVVELNSYVESIKSNYYDAQLAEISAYVTNTGIPMIEACTSSAQVTQKVNEVKEEISSVRNKKTQDVFALIESIPADVVYENKTTIESAVTLYNSLTATEKVLITNYAKLESAVAALAVIELNNYKEAAKAEVNAFISARTYNASNLETVNSIKANFETLLASKDSTSSIDVLKAETLSQIAAINEKHITDVEEAIALLPSTSEISVDDKEQIEQVEASYNALSEQDKIKVSNSATLTSARNALNEALLAKAKDDAVAELNAYKNDSNNYSPSKWNLLLSKKQTGALSINAATSVEDVNAKKAIAFADIDTVPTKDVEANNIDVLGWQAPTALTLRSLNISANDNKQFLDTTGINTYYVGDDNPFKFVPSILADVSGERVNNDYTFIELRSVPVVQIKENDTYRDLTSEEVSMYYSYNEYTFEFQFKAAALGKTFKLGSYYYYDDSMRYISSLEYVIVDGYNVHQAAELGVMSGIDKYDAHANLNYTASWNDFLQTKGIVKPEHVSGMIIHNSLNIRSTDIPSSFFVNGYLVDYLDVYEHQVKANETFLFEGNFFNISTEELPLCNAETIKDHVTHSTLFKFNMTEYLGDTHFQDEENTFVKFQNVSSNGNAQMTNDPQFVDERFGGLMFLKHEASQHFMSNVTIYKYFINIFGDDDEFHGVINMNNVQSYQAFQNNIFTYGRTKFNITNSILGSCGGPAIIAQHPYPDDDAEYLANDNPYANRIPVINVDENTVITSKVQGTENWFAAFGATNKATEIKGLNAIFQGMGFKGYVNDKGEIDIVMIGMNNSHTPDGISTETKSVLKKGNATIADVNSVVLQNPQLKALHKAGIPIFAVSDANGLVGLGYYSPQAIPAYGISAGYTSLSGNYQGTGPMYISIYVGGLTVTLSFDNTRIVIV